MYTSREVCFPLQCFLSIPPSTSFCRVSAVHRLGRKSPSDFCLPGVSPDSLFGGPIWTYIFCLLVFILVFIFPILSVFPLEGLGTAKQERLRKGLILLVLFWTG